LTIDQLLIFEKLTIKILLIVTSSDNNLYHKMTHYTEDSLQLDASTSQTSSQIVDSFVTPDSSLRLTKSTTS